MLYLVRTLIVYFLGIWTYSLHASKEDSQIFEMSKFASLGSIDSYTGHFQLGYETNESFIDRTFDEVMIDNPYGDVEIKTDRVASSSQVFLFSARGLNEEQEARIVMQAEGKRLYIHLDVSQLSASPIRLSVMFSSYWVARTRIQLRVLCNPSAFLIPSTFDHKSKKKP